MTTKRLRLRDVELGDLDTYVRMRCDPVMMAELGGPQPREGIEAKVRRDVEGVASGLEWIKIIIVEDDPAGDDAAEDDATEQPAHAPQPHESVAGTVVLWSHKEDGDEPFSETGWMVLPEFQGRGLAKRAVRELLRLAHADGRWGLVHAFPATTNGPSNGICRSLGFRLIGTQDVTFVGRTLHSNHWVIDPATVD